MSFSTWNNELMKGVNDTIDDDYDDGTWLNGHKKVCGPISL